MYFNYDIKNRALSINLAILFYGLLSYYIKPYKTKMLNKLDLLTTAACFFSIYFGLMAVD